MMRLFIKNLSDDTSEQELRGALEAYGPVVEFHRPLDRDTGRPRGFAFVTLGSMKAGDKAIAGLDGSELGGRKLTVKEAEERRARHPADGPPRASVKVDKLKRVDDRPLGPDGKRVRYKGI